MKVKWFNVTTQLTFSEENPLKTSNVQSWEDISVKYLVLLPDALALLLFFSSFPAGLSSLFSSKLLQKAAASVQQAIF